MADDLNKKQRQECLETFQIFDQDRDGRVTTDELGEMLKNMGFIPTIEELEELVSDADPEGNGALDFKGFMHLFQMFYNDMKTEDQIKSSFRVYDKNGDGYITHSELKLVLQNIGENVSDDDINDIIAKVDRDNDGKINYKGFDRASILCEHVTCNVNITGAFALQAPTKSIVTKLEDPRGTVERRYIQTSTDCIGLQCGATWRMSCSLHESFVQIYVV